MTAWRIVRKRLRPVKRSYRRVLAVCSSAALTLLEPLIFSVAIVVGASGFRAPIIKGIGWENRQGTERWMLDLLRRLLLLSGSSGLIDVGANIGQTLLKLKSLDVNHKYIGFEPNPFCLWYLNELIRMNRFREVDLYPAALSDGPAMLEFVASSDADSGGSIVVDLRPGKVVVRKQRIAAFAFDDLSIYGEGINLIKIDVEGAELQVLLGMRGFIGRSRPIIVCEVLHAHSKETLNDRRVKNEAIEAFLGELGYSIFRLIKAEDRINVLESIDTFPHKTWGEGSAEQCDYLLAPSEKIDGLSREFGTRQGVSDNSPPARQQRHAEFGSA